MMNETRKSAGQLAPPNRRQIISGAAPAICGLAAKPIRANAGSDDGISRTAESIHQDEVFKANRKRVYEALTDARQFNKVTQLSTAMRSSMVDLTKATEISWKAGGAFQLFGGYITGRRVELVPNERIVQAWDGAA